jgi:hypothetical protein
MLYAISIHTFCIFRKGSEKEGAKEKQETTANGQSCRIERERSSSTYWGNGKD